MLPKAMHLNEEHIKHGCQGNQEKCPVALMLNEHLPEGWVAFTEFTATFLLPSKEHLETLKNLDTSDVPSMIAEVVDMGGIVMRHEDRLLDWIIDYDQSKTKDMFTCHVFPDTPDNPEFLYMNRTGYLDWKEKQCSKP